MDKDINNSTLRSLFRDVSSRNLLPYLLFLILVSIFLWRPIFKGEALLPGDYLAQMSPWNTVTKPTNPPPQWNPLQWDAIAQFYPWRVFYARSMHSGHLPLWNPHQFSGTPFLANGQSAMLYPGNLLFLIFNPITAFTLFAALHLFLAQAFTYKFMRELGSEMLGGIVAAICFAFSAFMVLWLELPTFISVAVYLPLILFLIQRSFERRSIFYGLLAGGSLGLTFLAGHLQIAFYVALATVLWWLWKFAGLWRSEGRLYAVAKVTLPFIAFLAIAILISAAQVFPSQELSANSHRVRQVTSAGYSAFVDNAIKPYRLVTMFVPDFFGNPSKNNYYLLGSNLDGDYVGNTADFIEYGLYAGILPLMLALFAFINIKHQKKLLFFGALALFAVFSATGTLINLPFYYLIPGFSALGGPNRILVLYFFSLAVLAGFGADTLTSQTLVQWKTSKKALSVIILALLIGGCVAITWRLGMAQTSRMVGLTVYDELYPYAAALLPAVILLISIILIASRCKNEISGRVFAYCCAVFIMADLFSFGISYNPTCDRSKVYPDTPLTKKLQSLTKDGARIAPINGSWSLFKTPDAILPPNAAMVYGLYDVQGYDSLFLKSYQQELARIGGVDPSPPENGNMLLVKQLNQNLNKLAQYVVSRQPVSSPYLASADNVDGVFIYRLLNGKAPKVEAKKETFYSFRFGLYLMFIGISMICGVGTYHFLKYNYHR